MLGVLPVRSCDRESGEFAKCYVIPTQHQEEDRPDITQAAGADKPCTVDKKGGGSPAVTECIKLGGICTQECPSAVGSLFWALASE